MTVPVFVIFNYWLSGDLEKIHYLFDLWLDGSLSNVFTFGIETLLVVMFLPAAQYHLVQTRSY